MYYSLLTISCYTIIILYKMKCNFDLILTYIYMYICISNNLMRNKQETIATGNNKNTIKDEFHLLSKNRFLECNIE